MGTLLELEKKARYTYQDYEKLPEGAPYQLIRGELIMTPSPAPYHQDISRNLEFLLLTHVKNQDLGELFLPPPWYLWGKLVATIFHHPKTSTAPSFTLLLSVFAAILSVIFLYFVCRILNLSD